MDFVTFKEEKTKDAFSINNSDADITAMQKSYAEY
jgi:hypothetical protein